MLNGLAIPVRLFPDPVPTPLLSFSVPHFGAAAGVAVTASHNPPRDNGYKVYLSSGAQLVPPIDAAIAACIAEAPHLDTIARPAPADAAAHGLRLLVDAEDTARSRRPTSEASPAPRCTRATRCPCGSPTRRCTGSATGSPSARSRAPASTAWPRSPRRPTPTARFRTVPFPNPEEPGAMDRVAGARRADAGRARPRQRPRRGPPGRRRPRPLDPRLPHALGQRGRRPPRRRRASSTPRPAGSRSSSSPRSCPPASCRAWPATAASRAARRSPASSGSSTRRSRGREGGARLRLRLRGGARATPWARSCATRTASAPRCTSPGWPGS